MWKQDMYHFLPALFLLLGLLIYQRWDQKISLPKTKLQWGSIGFGLFLLSISVFLFSPWVAGIATSLLLCVFLSSQRDVESQGSLLYLWPLTLLWVRLPVNLDIALVSWLQSRSSQLSSFVLDLLSVPHALQGNIIELPTGRLFVEEACSGVQSLFTIVFLSLAIVVYNRRRLWLLPFYLVAAIFWAGLMNVARLVTIGFVRHRYDLDWSQGLSHQLVGYFYLALAAGFLLSTDRLLRVLFYDVFWDKESKLTNPFVHTWNQFFSENSPPADEGEGERKGESEGIQGIGPSMGLLPKVIIGLFVAVSVCSLGIVVQRSMRSSSTAEKYNTSFLNYPAELAVPGVQIRSHDSVKDGNTKLPFGQNADVWRGNIGPLQVALAVNQPYPQWHDLNECYTGIGWVLNRTENITDDDGTVYSRSTFVMDNRYGYLWFVAFDETGRNIRPATNGILDRIGFFVFGRNQRVSTIDSNRIAIAQMFVESSDSVILPFDSELQTAFDEFRKISIKVGTGSSPSPTNSE